MRQSLIFRAVRRALVSFSANVGTHELTRHSHEVSPEERQWETSEPRIQSWRRPAAARAGVGGAKRPTQREAPRARSRAGSVRTSA